MPAKLPSAGRRGSCGPPSLQHPVPVRHLGGWQLLSRQGRWQRKGHTGSGDRATKCQVTCTAARTVSAGNGASPVQQACKPRVLIAGAGIGGLVLAVGLLNKGFEVQVFERDLTAIRGEGKYRGPIQVQPCLDIAVLLLLVSQWTWGYLRRVLLVSAC